MNRPTAGDDGRVGTQRAATGERALEPFKEPLPGIAALPFDAVGAVGELVACSSHAERCPRKPVRHPACVRRGRLAMRHRRIPSFLVPALRETYIDFASAAWQVGMDPGLRHPAREDQIDAWLESLAPALPREFGLVLGREVRAESLGLPGLAARFADDFGAALARVARYSFLGDAIEIVRGEHETTVAISSGGLEAYARRKVDCVGAGLLAIARQLTGAQVSPVRVTLAFPPPESRRYEEKYRRTFQRPVEFDGKANAMVLANSDLARPIRGACPELADMFSRHAEEAYAASRREDDIPGKLRSALRANLFGSCPTLAELAVLIDLPAARLLTYLRKRRIRVGPILSEVRKERALLLLRHCPEYSNEDVADLVGMDIDSFRKMFKRWTGMVPGDARQGRTPNA